jgi:hypothetical protein
VANEIDDPAAPEATQLLAELSPESELVWLGQRVFRTKLPWAVDHRADLNVTASVVKG